MHDGDTGDFSDAPFQILIIRGHDVAPVGFHAVDQAVVRVGSFVITPQPLEPRILGQLERQPEPVAHFFELGNDAVGHARDAFGEQGVHHRGKHVHFVLDAEVDEVCVEEDVVRRPQLHVVLEVEACAVLFDFFDGDGVFLGDGQDIMILPSILVPLILNGLGILSHF